MLPPRGGSAACHKLCSDERLMSATAFPLTLASEIAAFGSSHRRNGDQRCVDAA
jgi:hypothetical protein